MPLWARAAPVSQPPIGCRRTGPRRPLRPRIRRPPDATTPVLTGVTSTAVVAGTGAVTPQVAATSCASGP